METYENKTQTKAGADAKANDALVVLGVRSAQRVGNDGQV